MNQKSMPVGTDNCLCGSGRSYAMCCAPFHCGQDFPERPEALMRSRFSAFASDSFDYLVATLHPSKVGKNLLSDLKKSANDVQWLSLRVIEVTDAADSLTGFVEFVAFYRDIKNGVPETFGQLHERSRFVKEKDRWYYIDGVFMPEIKLGRNDLCWCGSGKKMKKCHSRSF